nr:MAG: ORF1 [TTV-like mini virus]
MPPFQRNYYRRNWWNNRKRRTWYRRRRFGKPFRYRKRRRRRVRRRFPFKRLKKLKKIKIAQWQPSSIKKCRIEGYLCLFQAGYGRYSNNYTLWKESIFPPHYPGGGGWSIQRLSLANLYTQHKEHMNYWTKSNDRLNLCRYYGCRVTLFREKFTDYIFTYMEEEPRHVPKYYYSSHHPLRLLTHKRKTVVPSFNTQPHKRKPYKRVWIPPPKIMKNQWFFQQQLSQYTLATFAAVSCSLLNMFGSEKAVSNNVTLWCLDTKQFPSPYFQYQQQKPKWGYQIAGNQFLYGVDSTALAPANAKWAQAIYLGNTMENKRGSYMTKDNINNFNEWGNPFYWMYLQEHLHLAQTQATEDPSSRVQTETINTPIGNKIKENPYIFQVRYNPFKDKGTGNRLYVVPNYLTSKTDWTPPTDTDLILENYPLWLMAWGFEDIIKRMGKCPLFDQNFIAVFQSSYLSQPEQYFVILSNDFIIGRGAYNTDPEHLLRDDYTNWHPRWKYQRQAFNNIVMSGPAVATGDYTQNIQAKMKYDFYFKWGGNSSPQENVYDPVNQPVTPVPHFFNLYNEIINPATSITGETYAWDFRRDFLTETATQRIKESISNVCDLFTDGDQHQTALQQPQKETQEEETPKTQTETLFQQLQQIQQFNNQLQLRFLRLKQSLMDQ